MKNGGVKQLVTLLKRVDQRIRDLNFFYFSERDKVTAKGTAVEFKLKRTRE